MINHTYQCIFIEVPKTGSTSIRSILGEPDKPHLNIKEVRENFYREFYIESSNPIKRYFQQKAIGSKWKHYYKFGFVRNPWDRVVSLYSRKEGIRMAEKMSFAQFVHWIQNSSDTSIHPSRHKNQLDWFLDGNGKIEVDLIGKFENIDEEWKTISSKLKIDSPLPHENKNPAKKKHYSEYYSDELRDIIADKFRVDIEYFGYEFEDKRK